MGCLHTATMSAPADGPPGAPTTGRPLTPAPHLSAETSGIYPGGGMDARAVVSTAREALAAPRSRGTSRSLTVSLVTRRVTGP